MWTEERLRRMKQLFEAGCTTREIAAELGHGITRNAVVGKVHRLGLSKMNGNGAKERELRRLKPPPPPKPHWAKVEPGTRRVILFELTDAMCRWPIGDPQDADFGFCGNRKMHGHSYCAFHTRAAYIRRS